MKSETIERMFPIHAVEKDLLVSTKGDISVAYALELPPIYSLGAAHLSRVNKMFDKMLRSLPEGTIVQKQDYFFKGTVHKGLTENDHFLSKSDNRFFFEKDTMHHVCYLILTKEAKKNVAANFSEKGYPKFMAETGLFLDAVATSIVFLEKEDYFKVRRLNGDGIMKMLDSYFSLAPSGNGCLRDLFFDKRLQVGDKVGEIYAITTAQQLPLTIPETKRNMDYSTEKTNFQVPFIQPITLGLECNHVYNQVIYIDSSERIFSKLKTRLNQFKSLAILSKENEVTYKQIDELVQNVIENELRFVNQHFSVVLWDETMESLVQAKGKLENAFKEMAISPYQIKFGLKDLFLFNCPGATALIPQEYRFTGISSQTPLLVNFESYNQGNSDGILLSERKSGAPVRLDLWDEPLRRGLIVNRNRLIFGPSGTGKSFLINHIASQYYEQGHHIVMIDIGNSYKKLCQLVKGNYYAYDVDHPLSFNPFCYRSPDEINTDKKVFLTSLILFLWKGEDRFSREEKQIIGLYLDRYYDYLFSKEDEVANMSSFYRFVDAHEVLENENDYFDKRSFQLSLKDFHDGKYSKVLNAGDNINLDEERFIVFEMDNIKDHPVLFPLVTMLCINVIMEKIRKLKGVKKSIFIDECWKPISKGEMAEFIKYLYKTVRKFYGEIAIATQDVEDILDTSAGPAMINNTDTMILLSHKKKMATKDKFASYLSFTESDLEKLFSTEKREVFVKMGSLSNVYGVSVSPERYACYSSNDDENTMIYKTYDRTGNMELALLEFIEKNKK